MRNQPSTGHSRDKIKTLAELTDVLSPLRAKGARIVHCHGVFDLLHIGHIRHFGQARTYGDVLVVTLTPDRFVNKGPHRPAFPEQLRAEAVAALDCVDYVSINTSPTAVEAIQVVRPRFYVKGPDYRDPELDRTGGITLEEAAVQAVGGQLAFTEDITFSSTNLINRYLPVFPREVSEYLTGFAARYGMSSLEHYLDRARDLRVLVVGESIIDEYQYCEAIGKSSKEPMLATRWLSTERFAGGILAVANHLSDFCAGVGMVSILGAANSHEEFIRAQMNPRVSQKYLMKKDSPTIVKRRMVEHYFFTKLLEVYEINDRPLDEAENHLLCDTLRAMLPEYDVVVAVDFGHGMLTPEARAVLKNGAKFLAVNTQSNAGNLGYHTISQYPRADYVSITEGEMRLDARSRQGDLRPMVLDVARKLGCKRICVTRGKFGCLCYDETEGFVELPALAGQVVDRMGAGDAFLSLSSLLAAQGAPIELVGFLGNVAGAHAVATVGHRASLQRVPLLKHIESLLK